MRINPQLSQDWTSRPTLYPVRAKWLRRTDAIAQIVGAGGIVIGHGLRQSGLISPAFGGVVLAAMALIAVGISIRFRWSLAKESFSRRHFATVAISTFWIVGLILAIILGPILPDTNGDGPGGARWWGVVHVSEILLAFYSLIGAVRGIRRFAAGGVQPAILLVSSFLALITLGTIALMLPVCRATPAGQPSEGAPFDVAVFTATSASCVTGLIVVDTPTYWSQFGQCIILLLFQIGGLGIMTFGAFFAVIAGRNVRLNEFKTMRELLSSGSVGSMRQLVLAVVGFTIGCELIGAILLSGLWEDLPLVERIKMSVFHSVSAFCNAGFALTEDSFVGMAHSWRVSGVLATLIIIGGLGFSVLFNLVICGRSVIRTWWRGRYSSAAGPRIRLRLETKLALLTTAILLWAGWITIFVLEEPTVDPAKAISKSDAWFQSVTFRTAGFNTVDLGELQPATKLVAILLMVIGASPGSTGGGMKTIVFAIGVLGIVAVLRGRTHVEAFGRTISESIINRAFAIVFVTVFTLMITTILLVIFERRPELFLDHLFEATSAVGTVGVSTTVDNLDGTRSSTTQSLSLPSRFVIIFAMLLGRVGPLTLLLALSGDQPQARYQYPTETVSLG